MTVDEARQIENAALATYHRDETYANFSAFMDAVNRRERAMYEAHPCYGEPYKCISCGCAVGRPCISHRPRG